MAFSKNLEDRTAHAHFIELKINGGEEKMADLGDLDEARLLDLRILST